MLDIQQATEVIKEAIPDGTIQAHVEYKNLYLFVVFNQRPFEEEMDPFYSVDKNTGEFRVFSILEDGNPEEIVALFEEAERSQGGI